MQQFINTAQQSFQLFGLNHPGATPEQQQQQRQQQLILSRMADRVQQEAARDPRMYAGIKSAAAGNEGLGPDAVNGAPAAGTPAMGPSAPMGASHTFTNRYAQSHRHLQEGSSSERALHRVVAVKGGVADARPGQHHHHHHHHHHHPHHKLQQQDDRRSGDSGNQGDDDSLGPSNRAPTLRQQRSHGSGAPPQPSSGEPNSGGKHVRSGGAASAGLEAMDIPPGKGLLVSAPLHFYYFLE